MDALSPTPSATTLLTAQEAKDRLRGIVEGFFFRRLRGEGGKQVGRLLVKSPPGLGKTREAIHWAIRYQAEQEGKDGDRLGLKLFDRLNETAYLTRLERIERRLQVLEDAERRTVS